MYAVEAIFDGSGFRPLQPIPVKENYEVIITFVKPVIGNSEEKPKREIKLGFLKDKVPPLPDSFFDPLPEEELELWGL